MSSFSRDMYLRTCIMCSYCVQNLVKMRDVKEDQSLCFCGNLMNLLQMKMVRLVRSYSYVCMYVHTVCMTLSDYYCILVCVLLFYLVDGFLEVARDHYNFSHEQALGLLFWFNYDISNALAELKNYSPFEGIYRMLWNRIITVHFKPVLLSNLL